MNYKVVNVLNEPTLYGSIPGDNDTAILIISGNPGSPYFYTPLAETLHKQTGHSIYTIGQFGHTVDEIKRAKSTDPLLPRLEQTVANQILHKIAFIDNHLQNYKRIFIAGHSVGSYICNGILVESSGCKLKHRIEKSFMLTPTIERFKESYNGRNLVPRYNRNLNLMTRTVAAISYFSFIKHLLVWIVCMFKYKSISMSTKGSWANHMYKGILSVAHPDCIRNHVQMANTEMLDINTLPEKMYTKNPEKFVFLYALEDGWVDKQYHQEFMQNFPQIDTVVEISLAHGWVEIQADTDFIANEMLQRL